MIAELRHLGALHACHCYRHLGASATSGRCSSPRWRRRAPSPSTTGGSPSLGRRTPGSCLLLRRLSWCRRRFDLGLRKCLLLLTCWPGRRRRRTWRRVCVCVQYIRRDTSDAVHQMQYSKCNTSGAGHQTQYIRRSTSRFVDRHAYINVPCSLL